jgi:signal transduction histidine kinase
VDLTALVDTVAESMREQLGGHEIRVVAPPGQYVWIDPDRVQQVLTNLLSNAAKYGYPGTEIRLEVAVRDDMVEVAVANWGRGIASDELPLLFRRFGRTRQARREGSTPGIGLGLYISKGLVEAHGGRMWVESEPGGLTTFRFVVPRAPREAQAPADPGSPAAPP